MDVERKEKQLPLLGQEYEQLINVEKDPERSGLEEMEDSALERYTERHYALIEKLEELGLPSVGQQFRLITRRTFNAIQFLEYIVRQEERILRNKAHREKEEVVKNLFIGTPRISLFFFVRHTQRCFRAEQPEVITIRVKGLATLHITAGSSNT